MGCLGNVSPKPSLAWPYVVDHGKSSIFDHALKKLSNSSQYSKPSHIRIYDFASQLGSLGNKYNALVLMKWGCYWMIFRLQVTNQLGSIN